MAGWWRSLRQWREQRTLRERPIPDALWAHTLARYPFLSALDAGDAQELLKLSTLFLARKEFSGAGGLQVTDEMAVAVAAQACLPVLKLGLHWYDGFVGIVMHPDDVVARREVTDEDGIVHSYDEELAGEAMDGGPMTLTWRSVAEGGDTAEEAFNVVIHEFAHVMDMRGHGPDGMPPLPRHIDPTHWARVMEAAYARLTRRLDAGESTVIDPYGEASPSEFFAVACEAFFVAGAALRDDEPYVYELLREFFQQDPAERLH
jgi:MtfA peptidase